MRTTRDCYCKFYKLVAIICVVGIGAFYYLMYDYINLDITNECQSHIKQPIPKLIHFIFLKYNPDSQITEQYKANMERCAMLNPGYTIMVWNEAKLDHLYKEHFPWFLPTYRSYRYGPIQRNDVSRYFLLYHFGGVYIDMDISCQVSIDTIIQNATSSNPKADIIALDEVKKFITGNKGFLAAFLASPPNHPFLLEATRHAPSANRYFLSKTHTVLLSAGSWYIARIYAKYPCKDQIHALSEKLSDANGIFLVHQFSSAWRGLDSIILRFIQSIYMTIWHCKWLVIVIFICRFLYKRYSMTCFHDRVIYHHLSQLSQHHPILHRFITLRLTSKPTQSTPPYIA